MELRTSTEIRETGYPSFLDKFVGNHIQDDAIQKLVTGSLISLSLDTHIKEQPVEETEPRPKTLRCLPNSLPDMLFRHILDSQARRTIGNILVRAQCAEQYNRRWQETDRFDVVKKRLAKGEQITLADIPLQDDLALALLNSLSNQTKPIIKSTGSPYHPEGKKVVPLTEDDNETRQERLIILAEIINDTVANKLKNDDVNIITQSSHIISARQGTLEFAKGRRWLLYEKLRHSLQKGYISNFPFLEVIDRLGLKDISQLHPGRISRLPPEKQRRLEDIIEEISQDMIWEIWKAYETIILRSTNIELINCFGQGIVVNLDKTTAAGLKGFIDTKSLFRQR